MTGEEVLDIHGIDAVLSRFRTKKTVRPSAEKPASEWEADKPSLLRPEALKSMNLRYRMIADRLASEVANVLRTGVTVQLAHFEQMRLRSFIESSQTRHHIFVLEAPELKIPAVVSLDAGSATAMIDRLVGGRGESSLLERDLTRIEQRILADVVGPVVTTHEAVLSGITTLTLGNAKYLGSPDQLRPLPPTEILLVARYELNTGAMETWTVTFGLPLGDMIAAIDNSASLPIRPLEDSKDRRDAIQRAMAQVKVGTHVEIGSVTVPLADVMGLDAGDVIILDKRSAEPFDLTIEGVVKYRGKLGRSGKSLAFKIVEAVEGKADGQNGRG